jgi:hypothetical protein
MGSSVRRSSRGWAALRSRVERGQRPQPWEKTAEDRREEKRRRKAKGKKRGPRGLRSRCLEAQRWEGDVRRAALESGLSLRVNVVRCGKRGQTLHWMFDDMATGRQVLDYWPSRGTWYCQATGEKGQVPDWWGALDQAQRQGVRMYPNSRQ